MKRCTKCRIEKGSDEFHVRSDRPSGRMSRCKACMNDDHAVWRQANVKHVAGYMAQYRKQNGAAIRSGMDNYKIRCASKFEQSIRNSGYRRSGIKTSEGRWFRTEDYDRLFIFQVGCCQICGRHRNNFKRRLAVDHDHITGVVRGLLCNECNVLLAFAHDSASRLNHAITYLKRNKSNVSNPQT